jgi:hypothetical protein
MWGHVRPANEPSSRVGVPSSQQRERECRAVAFAGDLRTPPTVTFLNVQRNKANKSLPERLVDEAIERYVDWREACAAVRHTYEQWLRAPADERQRSFAAYGAALDQEESAATLYGAVVKRIAAAA